MMKYEQTSMRETAINLRDTGGLFCLNIANYSSGNIVLTDAARASLTGRNFLFSGRGFRRSVGPSTQWYSDVTVCLFVR
jgi:hypothetical protein